MAAVTICSDFGVQTCALPDLPNTYYITKDEVIVNEIKPLTSISHCTQSRPLLLIGNLLGFPGYNRTPCAEAWGRLKKEAHFSKS